MTDEKLEEKARQKARVYNTEYAEDCEFRDMISRPEDFIDGAIERMYRLLKEKHYRDGYIDGFKAREEKAEKENAELKEQIADLKNFCCEVSKYLHDNSVARPDASAYKKRDALLIKESKLCEKWGDLR